MTSMVYLTGTRNIESSATGGGGLPSLRIWQEIMLLQAVRSIDNYVKGLEAVRGI